jgi:hypothetical protein
MRIGSSSLGVTALWLSSGQMQPCRRSPGSGHIKRKVQTSQLNRVRFRPPL